MNRRSFMKHTGASLAAFAVLPSHVLGDVDTVAPSKKLNIALIGCGTQGLREMGALLARFRGQEPRVIPQRKAKALKLDSAGGKEPQRSWVEAFRGGQPTEGNFLLAGAISEAFNLGAISLRLGGKPLVWDSKTMRITNNPDANQYLKRNYRKGWEL